MIGASAHACSVLRPSWPFLKAMRVKDLSNHLQRAEMGWRCGGRGRSPGAGEEPGVGGAGEDPRWAGWGLQWSWGCGTCCSSYHAARPCRRG